MVGASKLTKEKVEEIRKLFQSGLSDTYIAEKYGVSRIHINHIRNGKKWNTRKNSFLMKDQITDEYLPQNYIIVSVIKDNEVVDTYNVSLYKLPVYGENIESCFVNNTGGWTIRVVINI